MPPDMRWVTTNPKTKWLGVIALMFSLQTIGCTTAVLQAGAEDPRAFALLPVALIGDVISAAADGVSSSPAPAPVPDPALLSWEDPGDWVADCDGPTFCEAPKAFTCYGRPGECYCACEMETLVASSGRAATSSPQ